MNDVPESKYVIARARPRSIRAHEAVLAATADLLWTGGLTAATVDGISASSGVSKATIYKHWPNRTAVAAEAFDRVMAQRGQLPDTGNSREDIRMLVRTISRLFESQAGRIFGQLLAACVSDPESAPYFERFYLARSRQATALLWQRAQKRGDVRANIDAETAAQIIFGPLIFRLLTGKLPISEEDEKAIGEAVLGGLMA